MYFRLRLAKIGLLLSDLAALSMAYLLGLSALILYADYSSFSSFEGWWIGTGRIHTLIHFIFILLTIARLYTHGLYSRRIPFWDELRMLLMTLLYLALLNGMVVLIAKWPFSRVLWLVSWTSACFLLPFFRSLTRRLLLRSGLWVRPTAIIGVGESAVSAYKALTSEAQLGFQVTHFIHFTGEVSAELPIGIPVVELPRNRIIEHLSAQPQLEIVVGLDEQALTEAKQLVEEMSLEFDEIYFIPSVHGLPLFGMDANHFFSHEVLMLRSKNNLHFRPRRWAKRSFDFVAAALISLLLSPLLLWIAYRIRRSGPGVLFSHIRIGFDGKPFPCYKFRSMVPNAEMVLKDLLAKDPEARREWEEKMKLNNDPRITPIGHFLRRTSLDELPQLWNVLRGEMSLVGPRPIIRREMERYGHRIDFYKSVRPGMTGLWQVSGRSDTDYRTRVHLDTWYVKNWTLWYDIAILFKTVKVVTQRKGAY